jgi:hypothetical protein
MENQEQINRSREKKEKERSVQNTHERFVTAFFHHAKGRV